MRDRNFISFWSKRFNRLFPKLIIIVLIFAFVVGSLVSELTIDAYLTERTMYLYFLNCVLIFYHNLQRVFLWNVTTEVFKVIGSFGILMLSDLFLVYVIYYNMAY